MTPDLSGSSIRQEIGFEVAASGGGLGVVVAEEEHRAWVTVVGWISSLDPLGRAEGVALITFSGVQQVVFGYPNEDALWRDPRGLDHGLCEIRGSGWERDLSRYNQLTVGADLPWAEGLAHYVVGSKDSSAQLLCRDFEVETFPAARWIDVHEESVRRLRRG